MMSHIANMSNDLPKDDEVAMPSSEGLKNDLCASEDVPPSFEIGSIDEIKWHLWMEARGW